MSYRISVLISTYDDAALVNKKLDEIRKQTIFEQAEFIFIETASPGRERQHLAPFCEQHSNCRLIALDERKTLFEAWNLGWDTASAPIICYSNMDDCMHPKLLEEVVAAMEKRAWDVCTVLIAKQPLANIDRKDMWSLQYLKQRSLSHRPGPFTAWSKSVEKDIGKFDPEFYAAGDKDFWARVLARNIRYGLVKKVLYIYSKSDQQLSKSDAGKQRRKHDKILAAEKPYPYKWPYSKFPYYYFLILTVRLFPKLFYVPEY
jgi:GT2 family glycosyltransferase